MNKTKDFVSSEELVQVIVGGMKDKKAEDITILDLRNIESAIADFFVICTAGSFTHLDAVTDHVEEQVGTHTGERPNVNANRSNQKWLVLDYFSVVVHLFLEEQRQRYNLEDLWGDAKITSLQNN